MNRLRTTTALLAAHLALGAAVAGAQTAAPLVVGQQAPDFSLPAARQSGVLPQQIRLSELRGSTVVLAFFYQARTKG